MICRIKYCRIQELRNCSFSFKTSSFAMRNSDSSLRCGSSRQVTFEGAKRILWPQKYNLLGSNCKPKSTKKRIVSPLFSSSLYQGLTDQDTCCSCCWYLCSSDSAVVVTLHIDMFSLSCRVLDIQGCNTLCVHVM